MKKTFLKSSLFALAIGLSGTLSAQNIYTYAGIAGGAGGYSGDGSHAVLAQLAAPGGMAASASGAVYFCDTRNFVVRKVDASGIITTVAGNNTTGYSGDGGPATDAQLQPTAVALDRNGNLYITDRRNSNIRKVNTSGVISTIAGTGTPGYTGDGSAATSAQINSPVGIVVDTAGTVFFSDSRNFVVRAISAAGIIRTVAGSGTTGYTGDGGPATAATFARPSGLALKADGTLYIADNTNNAVRMVSTSGIITTVAGTGTAGYSGDGGAATAATLSGANSVALDASGNLYIAEATNNIIREVNTSNVISTYAGNNTPGYSGDGHAAVSAQLNGPNWTATDASGNVYVADNLNNVIRRVGAAVTSITIATSRIDTVCAGVANHFIATAYADATPHYEWKVNGTTVGSDSSGFTSSSLHTGDLVNCILLDTAGGSPIAVSGTILVDSAPTGGTIVGIATICVGSTSVFRDSVAAGGGFRGPGGIWSLSDGTIATLTARPPGGVMGIAAGTDTLIYTINNTCGTFIGRDVLTIIANPNGRITGPDSMCAGSTVTFSDSTTGGTWAVQGGRRGGTIDASGNFTAGMRPGIVYITYGSSPACSVVDSIIVDSLPRVAPIAGLTSVNRLFTITLTDTYPGGSWTSSDPAVASVNATTGVVYGVAIGTVNITYTVTSSQGCTGMAIYAVTVVDASGVGTVGNRNQFKIAPNPTNGIVNLEWNDLSVNKGQITISDVTGRTAISKQVEFTSGVGSSVIDMSALQAGIYLLTVKTEAGSYFEKIVKE